MKSVQHVPYLYTHIMRIMRVQIWHLTDCRFLLQEPAAFPGILTSEPDTAAGS